MKRFVVRSYSREFSNGRSSKRLRPNLATYIRIPKTDMHLHAASQYYCNNTRTNAVALAPLRLMRETTIFNLPLPPENKTF